eukprot:gene28569-31729_t
MTELSSIRKLASGEQSDIQNGMKEKRNGAAKSKFVQNTEEPWTASLVAGLRAAGAWLPGRSDGAGQSSQPDKSVRPRVQLAVRPVREAVSAQRMPSTAPRPSASLPHSQRLPIDVLVEYEPTGPSETMEAAKQLKSQLKTLMLLQHIRSTVAQCGQMVLGLASCLRPLSDQDVHQDQDTLQPSKPGQSHGTELECSPELLMGSTWASSKGQGHRPGSFKSSGEISSLTSSLSAFDTNRQLSAGSEGSEFLTTPFATYSHIPFTKTNTFKSAVGRK